MKKRIQAKIRIRRINKRFESGFIILGYGKKIGYKQKKLKNRCKIIQKTILIRKSFVELCGLLGKENLIEKLVKKELFAVWKKLYR